MSEVDELDRASKRTTIAQAPQSKVEYTSETQNEREGDRQSKRRRSNRDSARRSRERRMQEYQTKCDEADDLRSDTIRLQQQVADLTETNNTMMKWVPQLAEKCKELVAENTQLVGSIRELRRSLRYFQAPGARVINSMAEPSSLPIMTPPSCSAGTAPSGSGPRLSIAAGPVSSPGQTLQELANGDIPSPQTPQQLAPRCFSPKESSLDGISEGPMPWQPSTRAYAFRRPELSDQLERTWDPESYSTVSIPRTQISLPVFQYT